MQAKPKRTSPRLAKLAATILRLDADYVREGDVGEAELVNTRTGEVLCVTTDDITALAGCVVAQAEREEAEKPKRRKGK